MNDDVIITVLACATIALGVGWYYTFRAQRFQIRLINAAVHGLIHEGRECGDPSCQYIVGAGRIGGAGRRGDEAVGFIGWDGGAGTPFTPEREDGQT